MFMRQTVRTEEEVEEWDVDCHRSKSPTPLPLDRSPHFPAGARVYWIYREEAEKDDPVFEEYPHLECYCVTEYPGVRFISYEKPGPEICVKRNTALVEL